MENQLPTTMNHCKPTVTLPASSSNVIAAKDVETTNALDCHTAADAAVEVNDNMFRVRWPSSATGPVQKVCEICGKIFQSSETFRSHKKNHADRMRNGSRENRCRENHRKPPRRKNPLRLMCEVCGLRGKNPVAFARHQRAFHPHSLGIDTTAARHKCSSCDERFFRTRDLSHHIRLVHSPNLPQPKTSWFRRDQRPPHSGLPRCRFCGRFFSKGCEVEAHERVHTGVKPFQCETCGQNFRQKAHLAIHCRCRHTDLRPYSCVNCGKTFKYRADLRRHSECKHGIILPMMRQRRNNGVDVVAAAAEAADITAD